MKHNEMDSLRMYIKLKGHKMYEIASVIGIGQDTLYRWFRKWDQGHYDLIVEAIKKMEEGDQS